MRKTKLIATVLVLALFVCALSFTLSACNKNTEHKNTKAIIFATALFSGGLYDSETGEAVWEPFSAELNIYDYVDPDTGAMDFGGIVKQLKTGFASQSDFFSYVIKAISYKQDTLLWDLTLDADGNSNNPNLVAANDKKGEMDIYYGVFGIYKPIMDELEEKYGDEYDVLMFNYDWRYSPADAAVKLEKMINDGGYTDVILMSHSMGGPVVNQYLSRSQANRDKVELYMACAPATLGSFDALTVLCSPMAYVEHMFGGELDLGIIDIESTIEKVGDFIYNNQGLMALVPSWQYLNSPQYGEDEAGIIIDGVAINSKEELYAYYKTCKWAYYGWDKDALDGVGDWIRNDDGSIKIKATVLGLEDYYDSFFIDGEFVSDLVNTYYMVGTGVESTITTLTYDSSTETYTALSKTGSDKYGDGTMPYYSCLGGQYVSDIPDGHVIEYAGGNHMDVGASWKLLKDDVLRLIDSVQ